MACEICKAPYKAHYRPPPPRAPPRARPDNRMQVVVQGRDVFVVVADPESGLPTRHLVPPEAMDEEGDYEEEERMNPTTACVASLFLFILLSMLLSHLFAALPTDGPGAHRNGLDYARRPRRPAGCIVATVRSPTYLPSPPNACSPRRRRAGLRAPRDGRPVPRRQRHAADAVDDDAAAGDGRANCSAREDGAGAGGAGAA